MKYKALDNIKRILSISIDFISLLEIGISGFTRVIFTSVNKTALFIVLISFLISSCSKKDAKLVSKADLEIEKKVESIVSKMTLQQKIGQLMQKNYLNDKGVEYYRDMIKNGQVSSFLNVESIEAKNALQKIAMEESELKIPLIFGRDVIHGYRTLFPINIAQSCSWNTELVKEAAHIAGIEAYSEGVHWTFAPMIDITKNPKWGRVAETSGEDPYLTSKFAEALVNGYQGDNFTKPGAIAACAKHFVGYGYSEDGKDYQTTWIPENELRNIYLPSFQAAVNAGVVTLMSAFNDLNGIPTSGNEFTLRQILRKEWNFNGFVVSDWDAIQEMINHGYCADKKEAAYKGMRAGVDMEMNSSTYLDHLENLLKEGKISQKMIDDAVKNILRVKYKIGLFEKPFVDTTSRNLILCDAHKKTAKEIAKQSIVMLKNENNSLPLSKNIKKVAVIGPLANRQKDLMGCWAFDGKEKDMITPLTAIKEYLGENRVNFVAALDSSRALDKKYFAQAVAAAKSSDATIVFVGEESILSGEAHCRAFLNLPGIQDDLIQAIAATGKPLILVVIAGRPLTFDKAADASDAVLYAWHLGVMAGPAITDILFGEESPSGKLTITFPRTVGQVPIYYAHRNSGRPTVEKKEREPMGTPMNPVGYNSHFLDVSVTPAYPFGFGLSYTTFEYKDIKLSADSIKVGQDITVSATIINTGKVEATEIVQFYIHDVAASLTRPVKELKGFNRISLKPGESKNVSFTLTQKDLGFWNYEGNFITEPGKFEVWIASSSVNGLKGEFKLVE